MRMKERAKTTTTDLRLPGLRQASRENNEGESVCTKQDVGRAEKLHLHQKHLCGLTLELSGRCRDEV